MTKKYIIISTPLVVISLITFAYLKFISQAGLLKNHYPVFSADSNSYSLSSKKPVDWTPLAQVSKEAKYAIILSEDWAFFEHSGVDLNQLKIVIKESIESGELTRGASTITQQVVKNAFLSNERSIFRKLKEFLLARELESELTKDQILEIYLNLIQLGDGVYGIKAGSEVYFEKTPAELNAKEGSFLAMLLPSPVKYAQSFHNKKLTSFAVERIEAILLKLKQTKVITEQERIGYSYEKLSFETKYASDYLEFSPSEKEGLDSLIDRDL